MYKKILVPLDDSRFAEASLEQLKTVVSGSNLPEVVLFMVLEPVYSFAIGELAAAGNSKLTDYVEQQNEEMSKSKASVYLNNITEKLKIDGLNVKSDMVFGSAATEILAYAENNQFDLIIISTHGKSGISRLAFGSVAGDIIKRSAIPVLMAQPFGGKS